MSLADRLRRLDSKVIDSPATPQQSRLARMSVVGIGAVMAATGLSFLVLSAIAGSRRAAIGSLVLLACGGMLAIGGVMRLRRDAKGRREPAIGLPVLEFSSVTASMNGTLRAAIGTRAGRTAAILTELG